MSKNKKSLLNENSIRRFMKLAEIDGLSDQFVAKNYISEEDEMDVEDEMPEVEMDAEMDAEMEAEPEMEADAGVEAEISPEAAEAIVDLAAQLEDVVGVAEEPEMPEDEEDEDLGVDMVTEQEEEDLMEALTKRVMNRLASKRSLHEAKVRKLKKAKRIAEVADRVWDRIVKSSK